MRRMPPREVRTRRKTRQSTANPTRRPRGRRELEAEAVIDEALRMRQLAARTCSVDFENYQGNTYAEYDQRGERSSGAYTTGDGHVRMLTQPTMPGEEIWRKSARDDAEKGPVTDMRLTPTLRRGAMTKEDIYVSRAASARG
jgi:hypothetical protein